MHLIILFVFNPLKQKNIHIRYYTVVESSLSSYQWITAAKYYGSSAEIPASSSQHHNLCLHEENDSVFPPLFIAPSDIYYILVMFPMFAVYDVSIAYKHQLPTFLDNVFGTDPSEVHIHVRRIPAKEIPASDSEAATWLMDRFQLKDRLLSDFKAHGHFPSEGTEQELSTLRCLVNFTVVISLTAFFIYLTLFSSIWFKTYVSLACAYLASATHFKFRPLPVTKLL